MLHRLSKIISAYVTSASTRKNLDLDPQNFTVEITVVARQANGEPLSVKNTICVENGLPRKYSEAVHNASGQILDFVAGSSGNKAAAQDELVKSWPEVKGDRVKVEQPEEVPAPISEQPTDQPENDQPERKVRKTKKKAETAEK